MFSLAIKCYSQFSTVVFDKFFFGTTFLPTYLGSEGLIKTLDVNCVRKSCVVLLVLLYCTDTFCMLFLQGTLVQMQVGCFAVYCCQTVHHYYCFVSIKNYPGLYCYI